MSPAACDLPTFQCNPPLSPGTPKSPRLSAAVCGPCHHLGCFGQAILKHEHEGHTCSCQKLSSSSASASAPLSCTSTSESSPSFDAGKSTWGLYATCRGHQSLWSSPLFCACIYSIASPLHMSGFALCAMLPETSQVHILSMRLCAEQTGANNCMKAMLLQLLCHDSLPEQWYLSMGIKTDTILSNAFMGKPQPGAAEQTSVASWAL